MQIGFVWQSMQTMIRVAAEMYETNIETCAKGRPKEVLQSKRDILAPSDA